MLIKRLFIIVGISVLLLLTPLVAMQFTNEVNWTLLDFVVAAVLLLGSGLIIELVFRLVKKKKHKIVISMFVIIVLLLIWVELAVGIFGTPFAGD